MFTVNQFGIGSCVLGMLKIFSGGRETQVEGEGSRVVVAVGKRETAVSGANVVTPYKKCIIINMHSVL